MVVRNFSMQNGSGTDVLLQTIKQLLLKIVSQNKDC